MSEMPRNFRHFCRFCGGIITSKKSIARGYGPKCWQRFKPKDIKPYIQEVQFVESALVKDDGSIAYLERCYPELTAWEDSF